MTIDLTSPSIGLDRHGGRAIPGWDHVVQSIEDIFTTRFSERVAREWYGSQVMTVLGENMNLYTIARFQAFVGAALDQFEPRVKVRAVQVSALTRLGGMKVEIDLLYRPRAMLGDFAVEGARKVVVSLARDGQISTETVS